MRVVASNTPTNARIGTIEYLRTNGVASTCFTVPGRLHKVRSTSAAHNSDEDDGGWALTQKQPGGKEPLPLFGDRPPIAIHKLVGLATRLTFFIKAPMLCQKARLSEVK